MPQGGKWKLRVGCGCGVAVLPWGVERWLGERKNLEEGGREEDKARGAPPVRRGQVAEGQEVNQ